MSFVVDASAAMAWCFEDERSEQSDALLHRVFEDRAHAPSLWALEIVNTLAVAERRGRTSVNQTNGFIQLLRRLRVELHDSDREIGTFRGILDLTRRYQLSAYDASYLELALHLGLPLATRDKALIRAASDAGVFVLDA